MSQSKMLVVLSVIIMHNPFSYDRFHVSCVYECNNQKCCATNCFSILGNDC